MKVVDVPSIDTTSNETLIITRGVELIDIASGTRILSQFLPLDIFIHTKIQQRGQIVATCANYPLQLKEKQRFKCLQCARSAIPSKFLLTSIRSNK